MIGITDTCELCSIEWEESLLEEVFIDGFGEVWVCPICLDEYKYMIDRKNGD